MWLASDKRRFIGYVIHYDTWNATVYLRALAHWDISPRSSFQTWHTYSRAKSMGKRKDKLRACTCWLWKIWAIKSANTRPYKILQLVTSILLNSCLQVGLWYWFTFFLTRGNLVQLQIFMHPWTLWRWELYTNCAELGLCFEVMRTGMNQGFLHSLPCRHHRTTVASSGILFQAVS